MTVATEHEVTGLVTARCGRNRRSPARLSAADRDRWLVHLVRLIDGGCRCLPGRNRRSVGRPVGWSPGIRWRIDRGPCTTGRFGRCQPIGGQRPGAHDRGCVAAYRGIRLGGPCRPCGQGQVPVAVRPDREWNVRRLVPDTVSASAPTCSQGEPGHSQIRRS